MAEKRRKRNREAWVGELSQKYQILEHFDYYLLEDLSERDLSSVQDILDASPSGPLYPIYVVQEAVEALKAWMKGKAEDGLMDDTPKVNLLLGFRKTPPNINNLTVKIALPHSPVPPGADVCLFVKDVNKKARDYTPSVDQCEALLSKHGVTAVTKVLPLKSLKTEYKEHEAKRNLSDMYEVFLADSRVIRLLPSLLGKNFFKRKRHPMQVELTKKDVKQEFTDALHRTQTTITGRGSTCMTCVGHLGQSSDHVTENVMVAVKKLLSGVPGGESNIKALHLKTPDSPALPIYLSLDSGDTVSFAPPPGEGKWEELEEISSSNAFIRIQPSTGDFQVIPIKKAKKLVKKQAAKAENKGKVEEVTKVEKNELTLVVRGRVTRKAITKQFKDAATRITIQRKKFNTGSKLLVAFIQMPTRAELQKYDSYVTGGQTLVLDGQTVQLDYCGERSVFKANRRKSDDRMLHISGISDTVKEKAIRALLPAAVDIRFPVTRSGKRKGIAIVEFGNAADVMSVMKKGRTLVIGGKTVRLDYMGARSQRKGSHGKADDMEADENEAPVDENEASADENEAPVDENEAPVDENEASGDEDEQPSLKRRRVNDEGVAMKTPSPQKQNMSAGSQADAQSSTPAAPANVAMTTPSSSRRRKPRKRSRSQAESQSSPPHTPKTPTSTPQAKKNTPKTPKSTQKAKTPKSAQKPKTPKSAQKPKTPKSAQKPKTPKSETPKSAQKPKTPNSETPKSALKRKTPKSETPKSAQKAKTPRSETPKSAQKPKTPKVKTPKSVEKNSAVKKVLVKNMKSPKRLKTA